MNNKVVREKQTRKYYWKLREAKAAAFNVLAVGFIARPRVQVPVDSKVGKPL